MNTHISELIRSDLQPGVMLTDAPDPRVPALGYPADLPELAPAAPNDTATVLCAILLNEGQRWRATLAFQHFYVSEEWLGHLFGALCNADLDQLARNVQTHASEGWDVSPGRIAFAVEVMKVGRVDRHVVCAPGHEPKDWRCLLEGISMMQSQDQYCSTLTFLDAIQGNSDAAGRVVECFTGRRREAQ